MDMTGQSQLWTPAIEAVHVQMLYDGHHGWSVSVQGRRSGQTWAQARPAWYGGLSHDESIDVLSAEIAFLLGLGDP